jgi:hypothetical protein
MIRRREVDGYQAGEERGNGDSSFHGVAVCSWVERHPRSGKANAALVFGTGGFSK